MSASAVGLAMASILIVLCVTTGQSWGADSCDALRPNPPQNLSKEAVGNIDAKLSGLTGKLLNAGGNLEGTYKEASSDVLKDYPNADKLYLWDRTIYLYCIVIMGSRLSDDEKANRIEKLMDRIGRPPDKVSELPRRTDHYQYSFHNIVSADPNYEYAVQVAIITDQIVEHPGFIVTCDGKIDQGIGHIPGQMVYTATQDFITDDHRSFGIKFGSPPFTPEQPFVITVLSHAPLRCDELRDARLIEFNIHQ